MTQLFHPKWLLIVPAFLTAIFIILSIIFSIFKLKYKKEAAIISSTASATIFSIINLCVLCLAPAFALFGIFFEFPVPIVTFLFGVSAISISNIIIEKSKSDIPFKEFIVTTLMITISLSLMFLIYLIPDAISETNRTGGENIHIHADLKVFITDVFGQEKELKMYTAENMEKNKFYHFHEGENQENVIHFEGKRGALADFLETINTYSLGECINRQYENKQSLYYFWVNGQPSDMDYGEYVVNDLDKILFKCGSEPPTQEQIDSVGNFACVQSKKC